MVAVQQRSVFAPGWSRPQRSADDLLPEAFRRVLQLVSVFRFLVSLVLLLIALIYRDPPMMGERYPELFALTAVLYLVVAAGMLLATSWEQLVPKLIWFQPLADILAVALLVHASGGVDSGLGGLLVVPVGVLSLLLPREPAFMYGALATLVLLGEQLLSHLGGVTGTADYAQAGLLGGVILALTALVQILRRRMLETEALAEQRGVDLANLAELNEYIIQHLRESIVVVDGDGRIRLMNESAGNHLGVTGNASDRLLEEVAPELSSRLERWREHGTWSGEPAKFASADGSSEIDPHFAPLGRDRGSGMLIFLEDTSLLAERVQQTKLAALGRLSASIAHEIRNPVGAMSHAGQLLAESAGTGQEEQRLTDIIKVNSRRVSQIIESVLALSRRERTRPEQLALKSWIEDFAREFAQTLELYEGAIAVAADSPEMEVRMDPTHLRQIVWNLCENSVKYASETAGVIAVELSCGRLTNSERPYLEIADRGPGIDPEKVEEIFEPFYTGQHGGTGLGLFISRELCECNGATLRYQARPGGGSQFRVVFADPTRWQMTEDNP